LRREGEPVGDMASFRNWHAAPSLDRLRAAPVTEESRKRTDTRRQRILLLTQWFEPEPTFKGLAFARELVGRGFDVEVVTGFPNYPGGTLYPGWRMSALRRETIDGVAVTRVPLYPSHDTSPLRRTANYLSFAASAALYCLFAARRPDVVYVYQLLTLAVVAAILKAARGVRFVFDIQDVWPDTLRVTGMVRSERVLFVVDRVARWVYGRADSIVVISPGFRKLLIERGVASRKIEVIYNWCDERSLEGSSTEEVDGFPPSNRFRVVFAGNIGRAQALDAVLDAADLMKAQVPHVVFVMIGAGVEAERLKEEVVRRGLWNVVFMPRVPMDQIGGVLRQADALLVHLKADPLFAITIPGKTQAYMSIGKPIVMAVAGDAADLVRAAQCGVVASPEDPSDIAAAVQTLAAMTPEERAAMGARARDFYRERLAFSVGTERFKNIFQRGT
jgi:colanic acid biosynthesis glycosyl transferase WcaI